MVLMYQGEHLNFDDYIVLRVGKCPICRKHTPSICSNGISDHLLALNWFQKKILCSVPTTLKYV